jgi:hypothetical protein
MRQLIMIVFSCLAFASPALAEPHRDWVRGDIRSVNGNLIRIDDTDVKLATDVIVQADTGDRAAPALAVGQNVTAVVEDGLVKRVEIHTGMQVHGNGPAGKRK